jgi:molybdenum cofactor cytidylyltransferase
MSGASFDTKVAAVVVAAGSSSRMPAIKQLLPWKDTTMLGYVIKQLEDAGAAHVFVVLGAHQKEILNLTDTSNITIIHNDNWSQGMGTSIAKTIIYLRENNLKFDGLLIAACDQPLIKLDHYKKLIYSCINNERIVVSSFGTGRGIPVVFGKIYFNELSTLTEDVGAKSIVNKHLNRLIQIDAPEAAIDLDTEERYAQYYHIHGIEL